MDKKQMARKWRMENKPQYELTKAEAGALLKHLQEQIEKKDCDETLRFTSAWLDKNISADRRERVDVEIEDMGGFCDCEVLCNCYEEYDIEICEEE